MMKDFDDLDDVIKTISQIPELVEPLLLVSKTFRETVPVQSVADELKALFMTFSPFGKMLVEGLQSAYTDGVVFRARLVKKVMGETGLSESTALALVLTHAEQLKQLTDSVEIKRERGDKK